MRSTAPGRVEYARVRRGGKGTSAPDVLFTYTVDGRRYDSDRFAPGFFAAGSWSGGGGAVRGLEAGRELAIHYDPDRPSEACLRWGWHPWSLGLPLFVVGACLLDGRRAARIAGRSLLGLGILVLTFLPGILTPSLLPAAAAVAAGAYAVSLTWSLATGR